MKILVVSDSHGDYSSFNNLVRSQSKAEAVIFLGDGCEEFDDVRRNFPEKMFIGVKGNNDWGCSLPLCEERVIEGKKFFITHGHVERVKYGLDMLKQKARSRGADIVLYGHTHVPYTEYDGGMYIMNPGSIRRFDCSYGIIDIQKGDILMNTAYMSSGKHSWK